MARSPQWARRVFRSQIPDGSGESQSNQRTLPRAPSAGSWWTPHPRVWSQRRPLHTSRAIPSPRLGRPPPQLPRDGRQADQVCGGAAGPGLPGLQARVPRARHLGQVRPHVLPRLHRGADSGGWHVPTGRAGMRLGPTGPQPGRHRTDRRPRSTCVRVYVRVRACAYVWCVCLYTCFTCACGVCVYIHVFTCACASVRVQVCVRMHVC